MSVFREYLRAHQSLLKFEQRLATLDVDALTDEGAYLEARAGRETVKDFMTARDRVERVATLLVALNDAAEANLPVADQAQEGHDA